MSLKAVYTMGENAAYRAFRAMRWPETEGEPICPRCGCIDAYDITTRQRFKCKGCYHQFSVISGTIFSSRKLTFTDLLAAIVIGWDELHAFYGAKRVNHSVAFMDEGVCTNQAESFFSRLRRMEVGTHHHIAGPYLNSYAGEAESLTHGGEVAKNMKGSGSRR